MHNKLVAKVSNLLQDVIYKCKLSGNVASELGTSTQTFLAYSRTTGELIGTTIWDPVTHNFTLYLQEHPDQQVMLTRRDEGRVYFAETYDSLSLCSETFVHGSEYDQLEARDINLLMIADVNPLFHFPLNVEHENLRKVTGNFHFTNNFVDGVLKVGTIVFPIPKKIRGTVKADNTTIQYDGESNFIVGDISPALNSDPLGDGSLLAGFPMQSDGKDVTGNFNAVEYDPTRFMSNGYDFVYSGPSPFTIPMIIDRSSVRTIVFDLNFLYSGNAADFHFFRIDGFSYAILYNNSLYFYTINGTTTTSSNFVLGGTYGSYSVKQIAFMFSPTGNDYVYADGILRLTKAVGIPSKYLNTYLSFTGYRGTSNHEVSISNIMIFNRLLTSEELTYLDSVNHKNRNSKIQQPSEINGIEVYSDKLSLTGFSEDGLKYKFLENGRFENSKFTSFNAITAGFTTLYADSIKFNNDRRQALIRPRYATEFPNELSAATSLATSSYSTQYYPYFALANNLNIIGSWTNSAWISINGTYTNQKFNVDVGRKIILKRIYLENGHSDGGSVNAGIKDFSVYGTNVSTAFTNTVFATLTDLNLLGTFQAAQHSAYNETDPQYFYFNDNVTPYRYYVLRITNNWGSTSYMSIRHIEFQYESPEFESFNESNIDIYLRFSTLSISTQQCIWKSGDQTNGIAIGLDATGHVTVYTRNSGVLTSSSFSVSCTTNTWFNFILKGNDITLLSNDNVVLETKEHGLTFADYKGMESLGGAVGGNPINGTTQIASGLPFTGYISDLLITEKNTLEVGVDDIRKHITIKSGETELPSEIVKFDADNNSMVLWTKVPEIKSSEDTIIDISIADVSENVGYTGSEIAQKVWDDEFVGVYHMIPSSKLIDSTSNHFDGELINISSANFIDHPTGYSLQLNGVDEYAKIQYELLSDMQRASIFSVFKCDAIADGVRLIDIAASDSQDSDQQLLLEFDSSNNLNASLYETDSDLIGTVSSGVLGTSNDNFVAVDYTGKSTAGALSMKVDGVEVDTDTPTGKRVAYNSSAIHIGKDAFSSTYFDGSISELFISKKQLNPDVEKVMRLSMKDELGSYLQKTTTYSIDVTVPFNLIESSLTNFPLTLTLAPRLSVVYPLEYSANTVKSTDTYQTYYPHYAVNPSLSKTGGWAGTTWIAGNTDTNKFNIDYGIAFVAKKIKIDNMHSDGVVGTCCGVQNITVYGTNSQTAFENTVYSNTDDLTSLGDFIVRAHIAENVSDTQDIDLSSNTLSFRYYVIRVHSRYDAGAYAYIGIRHIEFHKLDDVSEVDVRPNLFTNCSNPLYLIFTQGGSVLDTEIEQWDTVNKLCKFHVKIPLLSASSDTVIRITVGDTVNPNINYSGSAANVWDDNFVAVYHFCEDGTVIDSKNSFDTNSITGAIKIEDENGCGYDFSGSPGSGMLISANSGFSGNISGSITALCKPQSVIESYSTIWICGPALNLSGFAMALKPLGGITCAFNGGQDANTVATPISVNTLNALSVTKAPGSIVSTSFIYANGSDSLTLSGSSSSATPNVSNTNGSRIGLWTNGAYEFDGIIYELRISNVTRSSAWIKAEQLSLLNRLCKHKENSESIGGIRIDIETPLEQLVDFPVCIHLSASCGLNDFDASAIFDELGNDYTKLYIRDSNGSNLFIEVEQWDSVNKKAVIHVKVPSITAGTSLYIDSSLSNPVNSNIGLTGSPSAQSVWDSNFALVMHMVSNGLVVTDSTSNSNNGSIVGSLLYNDDPTYGSYISFEGSASNYVYINDSNSLDVTKITLDFVYRRRGGTGWNTTILAKGYDSAYHLRSYGGVAPRFFTGSGNSTVTVNDSINTWNCASSSYTSGFMKGFSNGTLLDTVTTLTGDLKVNSSPITLGQVASSYGFTGDLAELRISKIDRSEAWVKMTHLTILDNALTFVNVTSSEKKVLKLSLVESSTELQNFPLTIHLSDDCGIENFDASAVFSDIGLNWNKLIFRDSDDNSLYAEVEQWDSVNNNAVIHVKVPSIQSGDYIFLDYTASNPVNPNIGISGSTVSQNVWDSNFCAVFHMNQDPTGGTDCILDSTTNGNHGTPVGSWNSNKLVDTIYGKGLVIDGDAAGNYINCGNDSSLNLTSAFTIEAVVIPNRSWTATNAKYLFMVSKKNSDWTQGYCLDIYESVLGPRVYLESFTYAGGAVSYDYGVGNLNRSGMLLYYASTAEVGATPVLYENGTALTPYSYNTTFTGVVDSGLALLIGEDHWTHANGWGLGGTYLEVRISKTERSADWINYTYNCLIDSVITFSNYAVSNQIEDWTPDKIDTDLWLDAADSESFIFDGSNVSQWNDKSGNERHAIQSTSGSKPSTEIVNDMRYVTFNGSTHWMPIPSLMANNSDIFTVFIVLKVDNKSKINYIFSCSEYYGSAYSKFPFSIRYDSGTSKIQAVLDSGNSDWNADVTLSGDIATTDLVSVYNDALNSGLFVNGVSAQTGAGVNISDSGLSYAIGRASSEYGGGIGLSYFQGKIGELLFISSSISEDTRQKIEGYLAHKWGLEGNLPSNHPYKTEKPIAYIPPSDDLLDNVSFSIPSGTVSQNIKNAPIMLSVNSASGLGNDDLTGLISNIKGLYPSYIGNVIKKSEFGLKKSGLSDFEYPRVRIEPGRRWNTRGCVRFDMFSQNGLFDVSNSVSRTILAGTLTISMWVNPEFFRGAETLLFGTGSEVSISYVATSGKVICRHTSTSLTSVRALSLTGWNHIVYRRNVTTKVHSIFISGRKDIESTFSSLPTVSATAVNIGGNSSYPLPGQMSDVLIFERELTDREIYYLCRG